MATTNLDAPLGFRPVRNHPGGTYPQIEELYASSAVIYEGDMLIRTTAGLVQTVTHTSTAGDNTVVGVAAHYLAAGTAGLNTTRKVAVYNDPHQRYVVQSDDSGTPTTVTAYVGKNFAQTVTTGNTTTLQSKHELDSNTGTTAVAALRVHDVWTGLENSIVSGSATDSQFVKFVVSIPWDIHHYGGGAAV